MRINPLQKLNEKYLAVILTFVLFSLLFLLKEQEDDSLDEIMILKSSVELASSGN
tara:strand:+ start:515 stop:679 length:165 start_codon:yes stop_codon:yes gene_type:complete